MTKKLRVGIVGFGGAGMAQYAHFEALDAPVVAVFDPNSAAHDRVKERSGSVAAFDDFESFLKSGIDVVSICSPDRTHADYYARSLRAGKHTISEKPLTDSLEGCRQILEACRSAPDCVAAVQHQMRFLPVHGKMHEIVRSGALGQLSYIEGYYIHNLTTRAYLYDRWRETDNATPLVYSGCHFVDLLRWLLDDEVEEISGMANNLAYPGYPESDLNVNVLRFRSGVIGKVITAFGFGRPQDHSVRIYGSEKCIENNLLFDKNGRFSIFSKPEVPAASSAGKSFKDRYRTWRTRMKTKLASRLFEWVMGFKHLHPSFTVASYPLRLYPHDLAVRASLADFLDAIQTKRAPFCTPLDAAKTVATCLAGVEAYRTRTTVSVSKYWLPEFQ